MEEDENSLLRTISVMNDRYHFPHNLVETINQYGPPNSFNKELKQLQKFISNNEIIKMMEEIESQRKSLIDLLPINPIVEK